MPKGRTSTISSRSSGSSNRSEGSISGGSISDNIEFEGSGGMIGGGGSAAGSGSDEQHTTEQLNENLNELGTIQVQIESRTRGGIETVGVNFREEPGIADVSSVSGNTYEVDYENETCNCMHYRMRETRCRHIDAVETAMGQARRSNLTSSASANAIEARSNLDSIEDQERDLILQDQFDDEHFYLDNMDEFEDKLRNGVEVEYEYDNVLNGSDITFGVELEFVGGNANAIARDLYNEGICSDPERLGYHRRSSNPNLWKLESDSSVSSGSQGGELVSPILKDTPQTWRNIERICEIAKRHGATVNGRCGGHVHVGIDPLDTARQRWKRLFKVVSGYEECIYRAAGGDNGVIRRGYDHYAMPFRNKALMGIQSRITMNDEHDLRNMVGSMIATRYYGLNLKNISENRAKTVEFRYFNGSLNPKQIQANVKLAAGVVMAARKNRTRDIQSIGFGVSESFKRRGNMVNNFDETNSRSSKKLAEFLDIAFTRKKDKDSILNIFSKTTWRD
ncbi:amidoligase family protein [Clostridium saccharoperbutylacetonicum]|uniref:amidoligase family protein n=1 Tax=Clostridium saccharoperbutylacetonicum TaxID=36745 RepID=UPI0039E8FDB3